MLNFFSKLKIALKKSSSLLSNKIEDLFKGKVNEEALDKLEHLLFEANLGAKVVETLIANVKDHLRSTSLIVKDELLQLIQNDLIKALTLKNEAVVTNSSSPHLILIVGINGSGKTTSVAKLANYYKAHGKKVMLVAADTFRAAAVTQLEIFAKNLDIDIVKGQTGSDPASVVFDGVNAAIARHVDIVIIDTAGRLQVKTDLMNELHKIQKVCSKALTGAPHETLLVLDATIGQNAIDQAKTFHKFTPLSGLILTKLDGTAKGGAAIAIQQECQIPIKFIGVGEGVDDFTLFNKEEFVKALLT